MFKSLGKSLLCLALAAPIVTVTLLGAKYGFGQDVPMNQKVQLLDSDLDSDANLQKMNSARQYGGHLQVRFTQVTIADPVFLSPESPAYVASVLPLIRGKCVRVYKKSMDYNGSNIYQDQFETTLGYKTDVLKQDRYWWFGNYGYTAHEKDSETKDNSFIQAYKTQEFEGSLDVMNILQLENSNNKVLYSPLIGEMKNLGMKKMGEEMINGKRCTLYQSKFDNALISGYEKVYLCPDLGYRIVRRSSHYEQKSDEYFLKTNTQSYDFLNFKKYDDLWIPTEYQHKVDYEMKDGSKRLAYFQHFWLDDLNLKVPQAAPPQPQFSPQTVLFDKDKSVWLNRDTSEMEQGFRNGSFEVLGLDWSAEPNILDTFPKAEFDLSIQIGNPIPMIKVGEKFPIFRSLDINGKTIDNSSLKGRNVLLTFFPRCFTGGCSNHLNSLGQMKNELEKENVAVIAVSADQADGGQGQKAFAAFLNLPFTFIPDTTRELSLKVGAVQSKEQLPARMSVLIDKVGTIRWIDTDVHVKTHGADVLSKINELGLDK